MEEEILTTKPSPTKKPKKKNKGRRYAINLILILLVTIGYTTYSLWGSLNEVMQAISSPTADYAYLIVILALILGYYFLDGLILFFFARLYTTSYKLHRGFANAFIGQFYASITPSGSGRQFAQVATYHKQGVNYSAGASIMVMHYILYQVVLIFFGLLSIIINIDIFVNAAPLSVFEMSMPLWLFALIGFLVSGGIIVFMLLVSLSKKLHTFMINKGIDFLAKIKLVRNPKESKTKFTITTENFRIELRRLQSNIPATVAIILMFIVKFLLFYSISYFVGVMLDPTQASFPTYIMSLTRTSFLQMIIGVIPIPGGAGITEYLYEVLFLPVFGDPILTKAIQLVWRTVTFYSGLLVGGFVAALYRSSMQDLVDEETGQVKTFSDLQMETFAERKISSDTAYETSKLSLKEIQRRLTKDKDTKKRKNKE